MRVFPTDSKSGAKVLSVAGVYTAELLYYAVEQPLRRRAASTLRKLVLRHPYQSCTTASQGR